MQCVNVCAAAAFLVSATMWSNGCKENLAGPTPVDNPPVITSFSATPGTAKQNQPVTFNFQGTDDNGLTQAILNYEAGAADTLAISGTSCTGTRSHAYLSDGIKAPTLTLKDNAGKTTSKSLSLGVDASLPPVFNSVAFSGLEGDTLEAKINSIVSDPQSEALSVIATSLDPVISAVVAGDKIRVYGGVDMNGSHQFKVVATNTDGKSSERIYTGVWGPMDKIGGRAFDIMEGQYATGLRPELSLTTGVNAGNITDGFVIIDGGVKVKPDKNGHYSYPKVKGGPHTLQAFIAGKNKVTGNLDSSFVATYDLSPGDQTFDAGVNTNAGITFSDGTNWPLAFFKKLLYVYNFKGFWGPEDEGKLKGANLKVGNTYTYHIISDNTISPSYLGMSSIGQDSVEHEIRKFTDLLPPSWRPQIYKAKPGEAYPARGLPGDAPLRPRDNLLVVGRLNPDNPYGDGINFTYNKGSTVVAALIVFKMPFAPAGPQARELPAPLFCISDYTPNWTPNVPDYRSEFDGISEFSTHIRAPPVTNSGIKAIYLNGLFDQGTDLEKFWKMPF